MKLYIYRLMYYACPKSVASTKSTNRSDSMQTVTSLRWNIKLAFYLSSDSWV